MAKTADAWFAELASQAGMSPDEIAVLTKFANAKSADLNNVIKAGTEDYHAQLGRVRALTEEMEKQKADTTRWYETEIVPNYTRLQQELEAAKRGSYNPTSTDKGLTMADVQKLFEDNNARYASVIKEVGRISSRHAAKYQEELDTDALEKIAMDKKVSISQAYQEWISPREREREETAMKDRIKREREEAVREFASTHSLPVDPVPGGSQESFVNRMFKTTGNDKPMGADDIMRDLVDTWNGKNK